MKNYREYIDYVNLEQFCAVANTSTYLYNNFQKNQSLLILSISFSDQELISFFFSEYNEERTFKNSVTLYALIIAISLHNTSYTDSFFINLPPKKDIKWSNELANIYFSKMKVENFFEFDRIEYNPGVLNNPVSTNSPVEFNIS
jgi:hypothetical protein